MFVDIVGFSAAAERQTPRQAFTRLKETLTLLSGIVHKYGGVINKTLGDGMLCCFGYRHDGSDSTSDHADQALQCALEMQRETLKRCLAAAENEPVYPLRVGINSAAVYLGDLGDANKNDLTLIGHGVNLAKRLESACDTFDVLIGATTRDMLLRPETTGVQLRKRLIQIQHHDALIEAYETDPFEVTPELREKAIARYRAFAGIDRKETRWPVPPNITLKAFDATGVGQVLNFSENGLGVTHSVYLSRGVMVSLFLESSPPGLRDRLVQMGLLPVVCEVRWGRPMENGFYKLGFAMKSLIPEQRQALLQELRQAILPPKSRREAA
jgi:class 3 adenylate cyclase